MSRSDWDQENPYASPRSMEEPDARVEDDPNVVLIEPWFPRRDWIDLGVEWLIGACWGAPLGCAGYVALVLVAISAASVFGLGAGLIVGGAAALTWITLMIATVRLWNRYMVTSVAISSTGIRFERRTGDPRMLKWLEIRAMRPATRREVVLYAWSCPWRWPREPNRTRTALGHYRIEWADGYLFFPPKDPAVFEEAVRRFCPRLLAESDAREDG